MRLQTEGLRFAYGDRTAIDHISLEVARGEFVGLIGPNGSGKSTVLKNLYRALVPDSGTARLDGDSLLSMSPKSAALKLGVVGQENELPFDFTVEEIVAMGRSPHKKLFEPDNRRDRQLVRDALAHVGLTELAQRSYRSLSGGEKQRVIIARVMAQETELLLLDEPTNHLDISYQMQIFDFVRGLGATVLAAIHDLNMAALYCDRLYVLKHGRVALQGTPEQVLTPQNIYDVFGVCSDTAVHPETGRLSITFLPAGTYASGLKPGREAI